MVLRFAKRPFSRVFRSQSDGGDESDVVEKEEDDSDNPPALEAYDESD